MAADFGGVNFSSMDDMKLNSSLTSSSDFIFDKLRLKTGRPEEDLVELLWADGQVVMHNQTLRPHRQTPEGLYIGGGAGSSSLPDQGVFIQEDEMNSWLLQYPNDESDRDLGSDLFYSPAGSLPPVAEAFQSSAKPELPPIPSPDADNAPANFAFFSDLEGKKSQAGQLQVIPSIAVTAAAPEVADQKEASGGDPVETSFSGGSSASDTRQSKPSPANKKKRKRYANKSDGQMELPLQNGESEPEREKDPTLDHIEEKKPAPSARRKRAAEVHNMSERRRRDRINEKMKALQELIPHCNKSDKASMLDEAIEYLKSLQCQVKHFMHMMYSGMTPVVYPGVQPYIAPIGMRVGVGMGMDLASSSLSRPMLPFQPVVHGVASSLGQTFPISPLPIPHIPLSDQPVRARATSGQGEANFHLVALPNANVHGPLINLPDPYQRNFLAFNPIPKTQQTETNVTPLHTFDRTEDPDSKKTGVNV